MKKIVMTLAAVLCCAMTMMAEPVSPNAARQAAAKFLQAKGSQLKSEAMRAKSRIMGSNTESEEQVEASPYYVFNAAAEQGFVVVSGDDCVGENLVLGYAAQGSFDANTMPDNMQWWLDEMESQIAELSRKGTKAKAVELHENIDYMVTALWNQGSAAYNPENPYNALCPEMDGALCVTGCMATALAQVLYYHRWPQEPIAGSIPGYTSESGLVLEELPATTFDWQNMVDDYKQETTEEQQYAVAELMRYCGQSLQMEYTPQISEGIFYNVDMLVRLFGYDQELREVCADFYTVSGWDLLLYNELKEGRPLVYGGYSTGGGHAFVIDGYQVQDERGYFHVNWGWGGTDNGYFRISLLDSSAHGVGSSSTSDGYNRHQEALIGLQPAKGPIENYGRYLCAKDWNKTIDDEPNSFQVVNTSFDPGTYAIYLAERTADETLDFHDFAYGSTKEFPGYDPVNYTSWLTFTMPNNIEGLAPGRHEMVFMQKEVGTDAPWELLYGPNCYIEVLIDEGGQLAETIFHPLPQLSTVNSKITVKGIMQRGLRFGISVPITNNSDDDNTGAVSCIIYEYNSSVLGDPVRLSKTGAMIEAGTTETITIPTSVLSTGRFVAVLTWGDEISILTGNRLTALKNTPGYIGYKFITIEDLVFYCQSVEYKEQTDMEGNPTYSLDLVLGNGVGMTYDAVVLANLYKPNDEGYYDPVVFPSRPNLYSFLKLENNTWGSVSIELPEPLVSGKYAIELSIANDFHSLTINDYFVFASGLINVVGSGTGISDFSDDSESSVGNWFDLNGRKLSGMPTSKGVYIHNGKKHLIK